jgi:histidinol phosphatase-like enzyme
LAGGGKSDRFVEERMGLRTQYFKMLGYTEEEYKEYKKAVFISDKVEDIILAEAVNIPPETVEGYYNNLLKDGQTQMARTYTFTSADPVIQVYCPDGYR